MHGSFYLIKIKSGSGFVISKGVSFKFFSVFFCNLYRYNLITFTFNFINNKKTFFIFIFNSVNSKGAFFRFFFIFFSYNLCRYNLIIFIFNKKIIINNIQ